MKIESIPFNLKIAKKLGIKEAVIIGFLQQAAKQKAYKTRHHYLIASVADIIGDLEIYSTTTIVLAMDRLKKMGILEREIWQLTGNNKPTFCYGINQKALDAIL